MIWFVGAASAGQVTNSTTGASYPTIGQAVAAAAAGDTLAIAAGTYTEQVVLDRDLTLLADPYTTLAGPVGVTDVLVVGPGVSATVDGLAILASLNDANQRPVNLGSGAGVVTLSDMSLVGVAPMDPGTRGGGVLGDSFAGLTLRNVQIGTTSGDAGAAIAVSATGPRPPVVLDHVSIEVPDTYPGIDAVNAEGVALTVTDGSFGPLTGSAITATDTDLTVLRTTFCDVETFGAILASGSYTAAVRNSLFFGPTDPDRQNYQLFLGEGTWEVTNNGFFDTLGVYVDVTVSSVVRDNLFVGGEFGLTAFNNGYVDGAWNWFRDVDTDITYPKPDRTNRIDAPDPLLLAYSADGDCTDDQAWPTPVVSPLIDAGDPAILDPDGSISDIGPYGGPDADPAIHADSDGDGVPYLHDCDDTDPAVGAGATWYQDCDGDGIGDPAVHLATCDGAPPPAPACGSWVAASGDCDDGDPAVNPTVPETCAAGDSDCDGDPDLGAIDATAYFVDEDGDGFGGAAASACGAVPPDGVQDGGDCDDADETAYPGAADPCDGVDQDCDGSDGNEYDRGRWYPDADGDGYGDPSTAIESCDPVDGRVSDGTDCDDVDPTVHPGRPEICDDLDQNCDGRVDEGLDCATPDGDKPDSGCGCATGAAGSLSWGWLAALVALRARRSRRP